MLIGHQKSDFPTHTSAGARGGSSSLWAGPGQRKERERGPQRGAWDPQVCPEAAPDTKG